MKTFPYREGLHGLHLLLHCQLSMELGNASSLLLSNLLCMLLGQVPHTKCKQGRKVHITMCASMIIHGAWHEVHVLSSILFSLDQQNLQQNM